MKVKFFSGYASSAVLMNRFYENYRIYDEDLEFTIGEDYQYAVVFNRSDETIRRGAKVITIIQEPSWSDAHDLLTFLTDSDYLVIHDPQLFEQRFGIKLGGKVIVSPSYMFYDDKINHSFFDGSENIIKDKKLSIIISGLYMNEGNYKKRLDFLLKILASDLDIDIYGRKLNITDPRYKGELDFKHKGLLPYEYSIAIENSNEKNYITEKFIDCALCNTTPIYNGAPNITEVYDERFFSRINLESTSIIEEIKEIISKPAPGALTNKEIYFKQYNLYTKLKEIIFREGFN